MTADPTTININPVKKNPMVFSMSKFLTRETLQMATSKSSTQTHSIIHTTGTEIGDCHCQTKLIALFLRWEMGLYVNRTPVIHHRSLRYLFTLTVH